MGIKLIFYTEKVERKTKMDQTFMNELKRLGQELNDLTKEIDNDTAEKKRKVNEDVSAVYEVMRKDLEELQKLTQESHISDIKVKIPCDFTDSSIKEFRFLFPGVKYSNHKEVGIESIFGDCTSSPNSRSFDGWLYSWDYSKQIIAQEANGWRHKYFKKLFAHIINDWTELKPIIEAEFVKQYKEKLTDKVQNAIKRNEAAENVI